MCPVIITARTVIDIKILAKVMNVGHTMGVVPPRDRDSRL
jgi:hypothetical protein